MNTELERIEAEALKLPVEESHRRIELMASGAMATYPAKQVIAALPGCNALLGRDDGCLTR